MQNVQRINFLWYFHIYFNHLTLFSKYFTHDSCVADIYFFCKIFSYLLFLFTIFSVPAGVFYFLTCYNNINFHNVNIQQEVFTYEALRSSFTFRIFRWFWNRTYRYCWTGTAPRHVWDLYYRSSSVSYTHLTLPTT